MLLSEEFFNDACALNAPLANMSTLDIFTLGWNARCCMIEAGSDYEAGLTANDRFAKIVQKYKETHAL